MEDSTEKITKEEIKNVYYSEEKIGIIWKIKNSLLHIKKFSEKAKNEGGIKQPLLYYILLASFGTILSMTLTQNSLGFFSNFTQDLYFSKILDFLLMIIFVFVYSIITHIFVKIFKGRGNFYDTFRCFVYSLTPLLTIGVLVSYFFIILSLDFTLLYIYILAVFLWGIYIEFNLISNIHEIKPIKTAISIILSVAIFYIITFAIGPFLMI